MSQKRFIFRFVGPTKDFTLKPGLNMIGKYLYCQIHLDAEDIAGEHATVEVDDDGTVTIAPVQDAPLYLNGQPVRDRTALNPGDSIQVGETFLTLLRQEPTVSISMVRRSPRWRSFFRRVVLMLLLVGLTGGALYGLARILLNPTWVSAELEEYLSTRLHRDVQMEGVKVDLIGSRVTCKLIEFKDSADFKMAPVASLYGVDIQLENPASYLLPLLGQPEFTVEAREVSLFVRKDASGRYNIDDMLKRIYDLVGGAKVNLPSLSVVVGGGSVHYEEEGREAVSADVHRLEFSVAKEALTFLWDVEAENGLASNGQLSRLQGGTRGLRVEVSNLPRGLFHMEWVPEEADWKTLDASCSLRMGPEGTMGHLAISGRVSGLKLRVAGIEHALGDVNCTGAADLDSEHGVLRGVASLSGEVVEARTSIEADIINRFVAGELSGRLTLDASAGYHLSVEELFSKSADALDVSGRLSLASSGEEELLVINHDINLEKDRLFVRRFSTSGLLSLGLGGEGLRGVEVPSPDGSAIEVPFDRLDVSVLRRLPAPWRYVVPGTAAVQEKGVLRFQQNEDGRMTCALASSAGGWKTELWWNRRDREAGVRLTDSGETFSVKGRWLPDRFEAVAEGSSSLSLLAGLAKLAFDNVEGFAVSGRGKVTLTLGKLSIDPEGVTLVAGGRIKAEQLGVNGLWPDLMSDEASFVFNAHFPAADDGLVEIGSLRWEGSQFSVDGSGSFQRSTGAPVELRGSLSCDIESNPTFAKWLSGVLRVPINKGRLAAELAAREAEKGNVWVVTGSLDAGQSSVDMQFVFPGTGRESSLHDTGVPGIEKVFGYTPANWSIKGSVFPSDFAAHGGTKGGFSVDGPIKLALSGGKQAEKAQNAGLRARLPEKTERISGEIDLSLAAIAAGPFRKDAGLPTVISVKADVAAGRLRTIGMKLAFGDDKAGKLTGEFSVAVLPTSLALMPGGSVSGDIRLIGRLFPVVKRFRFEEGTYTLSWEKSWTIFPTPSFWQLAAGVTGRLTFEEACVFVALPACGWRAFGGSGRLDFVKGKVGGRISELKAPGLEKGTGKLTARLLEEKDKRPVLDTLSIHMGELADICRLLGFLKAWHNAGRMKRDIVMSGVEEVAPWLASGALRGGEDEKWFISGDGELGRFEGRLSTSAEGDVHITGRWRLREEVEIGSCLPGWPFPVGRDVEMEAGFDSKGTAVTRYFPFPPAAPLPLMSLLGVDVGKREGPAVSTWKLVGERPFVEYEGLKPVALVAALVADNGSRAIISGGRESGGVFRLRCTYPGRERLAPYGPEQDIRFTWDNGWKKLESE